MKGWYKVTILHISRRECSVEVIRYGHNRLAGAAHRISPLSQIGDCPELPLGLSFRLPWVGPYPALQHGIFCRSACQAPSVPSTNVPLRRLPPWIEDTSGRAARTAVAL